MSEQVPAKGYVFTALVVAIWTGFIIVSRACGVSTLTTWDVIAIRYTTAAGILLPVWLFWKRVTLFNGRLIYLTITGGFGYSVLVFSGFKLAPAAHAAILLPGLMPFAVAVIAWFLLGEHPTASRYLGLAIAAVPLLSKPLSPWMIFGLLLVSSGALIGQFQFFQY